MSSFPSAQFNTRFDTYRFMVGMFIPPGNPPDFSIKPTNPMIFLSDSVDEISITSEITSPIPTATIQITDRIGAMSNFVGKNNVYCQIMFALHLNPKLEFGGEINETMAINHVFCVDKIDLIRHTLISDTFKIELTSINSLFLSQNISYVCNNLTPIQALKDLASKANINIYVPRELLSVGENGEGKLSFVSHSNSTILESISHVISSGFIITDGPIFCTYDFVKNAIVISSRKAFADSFFFDQNQTSGSKAVRNTGFISTTSNSMFDRILISSLSVINHESIGKLQYLSRKFSNFEFDFDNGYWFKEELTGEQIYKNLSTVENNIVLKNKITPWIPKGTSPENIDTLIYNSDIVKSLVDFKDKLYDINASFFLHSNPVQISTVEGHVRRTPGDPFLITTNFNDESNLSSKMFVGPWTVIRVTHKIVPSGGEYSNDLVLARNEVITSSKLIKNT